jgi:hypothetical protein
MSVRVATTADITLSNVTTTVDGVTLTNGDLILVKNQTTGIQNGVYVVSTSGAWTRSSILPVGVSAFKKMFYVNSGTVNQNLNFNCLISPAVVGTDSLVFMAFNNAVLNNLSATVAPTESNDNTMGYSIGSMWINTVSNTIYICTNNSTGVAVWSQSSIVSQVTDYMIGNLTATVLTNLSVGDHASFNQAYQSSTGTATTTNITLDTSSTYSSATNTASIGRITLKANYTYSIMGIVKSLAGVDYYGYAWFNSDSNTRIGTRGEGFASTSQAASISSNPSYSTFTPIVDTRIELRLTESTTGSIINWYAGSTGYGETMFSISVATSATSSNSFVGATASVDGTQGLVPGPAAGKQLSFLRGDATWQSAVVGPVSSTNTAIATFNGTLGSTLQSSGVTVSATQDLAGAKTLALSGATSGVLTLQPAATTTSYTTTMPSLQGAANSVLQNNGAGILSWALLTGMKGIRYIIASGAYTPTAGTTRALVFVTGGGGAGGGAASGVNNSVGSGGNSGGTYVGLFVIDDTKTGTVTIGPGGTGVSGGGGNNGTDTTFLFPSSGTPNATITGDGGNGGNTKPTGTNDRYFILSDNDRAPGSATATNAVLLGGFPIFGTVGGTGSLNDPDIGGSGLGANSIWGGGAGAAARNDTNGSTAGNSATANSGSGGSGAIQTNNGAQTGGAGGSGRVVILEY